MTNKESGSYIKYRQLCLDAYYAKLNPAQREAVCSVKGPLLVLAGAGSGKTTVLVNRISHIIKFGDILSGGTPSDAEARTEAMRSALNGTRDELEYCLKTMAVEPASPENVLCITFTNKAAGEFKERLVSMLGDDAHRIWAGTFHSVCVRILRRNIGLIGYSNSFTIYDAEDSKKLITQIMKAMNIDDRILPAKVFVSSISSFKEERIVPTEARQLARDNRSAKIAEVYEEYEKRLKEASALDFDDLILKTLILFEEHPEVLERYREQFRYILVDEYQDTNPSQNMLVIMLGQGRQNVCVVGDDDQSIYSFRGATVDNILNFDRAFPEAKTVKLEQNYRSTGTVLSAANAVIAHNNGRKGKNLWTSGDEGEKITSGCLYTQAEEAEYIASEIMRLHAFGTPLRDIAVLYRMNAVSNALETAFVKNRLPYKVFGGIRFYERKEVKDIIAYMSLISNPADNTRLRRIINTPKRLIGGATVDTVAEIAARENKPMLEIVKNSALYPELGRSYQKLERFYALIAELADFAKENSVSALINEIIARTGYTTALIAEGEYDRADVVQEFVSSGVLYEQSSEEPTLQGFLEDVALVSDTDDYDESNESVSLMTVHSAKGLEFPVVFIAGFEQGVFPSNMSIQEGNIEEERRLAYVAITRAKTKLYITYTQSRTLYGFTAPSAPSSFLDEIPPELIDNFIKKGRPEHAPRRESPFRPMYKKREVIDFAQPVASEEPASPTEDNGALNAGDRVNHKFFGDGTVLSVEKMGGDALIEVSFDNGQTKKLMASFAKLRRV